MRIVLLNDDALPDARGGAAVIVDKLKNGYKKIGHTVLLVTTHQDASKGIRIQTDNVISLLSIYPQRKRHRHCVSHTSITSELEKIFQEFQPDVVHAHNVHSHLTYKSLEVAKKYTNNIVLTAHDTFLVSFGRIHGRHFEKLTSMNRAVRLHWWNHVLAAGRKYWPLRNWSIRRILKKTDTKVVAIGSAVSSVLEKNGIHVTTSIPNGVENWKDLSLKEVQAFRKQYNLTCPTILSAGRIRTDKGIDALLDAAELVLLEAPCTQFLIIGDHENLKPHLKNRNNTVKNAIVTTGWIGAEEARIAFLASNIVTTPSLYLDNFPTVNLEAMAASKPVVGTIYGGTPEVVNHNKTGFICNPRETEIYANHMIDLLAHPDKAKEMGEAGKRRVEKNFSQDKMIESYLAIFTSPNKSTTS